MIIVVGASASGKTELAKILYQTYGYTKCITTTTRSKRANEVDGRDYHFITEDLFDQLQKQNAFVEVTSYHGHRYGLQKKDILPKGIVILDPNGANHLVKILKQDAYVVFVTASEQTRRSRMVSRGDALDKINERLTLDRQFYAVDRFDQIHLKIINQDESLETLAQTIYEAHKQYLANL